MGAVLNEIGGAVCRYLLVASAVAAALPCLAWLIVKLGRIRAAVYRHAIWFYCVLGIALLPPLWLYAPKLKLAILRPAQEVAPLSEPVLPEIELPEVATTDHVTPEHRELLLAELPEAAVEAAGQPLPVRPLIAAVWLAGVAFMFARFGVGWLRVRKLCRSASPLTHGDLSAGAQGPLCFGIFRPFVILPERLLAESAEPELRMILSHELRRAVEHAVHEVGEQALAHMLPTEGRTVHIRALVDFVREVPLGFELPHHGQDGAVRAPARKWKQFGNLSDSGFAAAPDDLHDLKLQLANPDLLRLSHHSSFQSGHAG